MTEPVDASRLKEQEAALWEITEPGIPLYMNVTLTIEPEHLESYIAALNEVLPLARAEPTCLYLNVGRSMIDPNVFILSEGWRDLVEYRDTVRQRPYFTSYVAVVESVLARSHVTVPLVSIGGDPA